MCSTVNRSADCNLKPIARAFSDVAMTVRNAVSVMDARPLSNSSGTVLDPVLALRRRVRVAPGETVRLDVWTLVAPDRAQALALVDSLRTDGSVRTHADRCARVCRQLPARPRDRRGVGPPIPVRCRSSTVLGCIAARGARGSCPQSSGARRALGYGPVRRHAPSCWSGS